VFISLLAWSLVAGMGALMARVLLSRWEVVHPDGSREVEETTGHEVVKWGGRLGITAAALGALAFMGPGVGIGLGGMLSRAGGSTGGTPAVGQPNAPTIDVAVTDTSTWRVTFSAFVGSGADTQDSISVTVLRSGAADTLFHAKSGVQTADTISDNADLKADTTYRVLGRQKGASGGWSNADTLTVVNDVWDSNIFCATGPNYPDTVNDRRFCLDVTQADQEVLNTVGVSQGAETRWTTPQTSPNNGAFFNRSVNDTVYAAFIWKSGQTQNAAGTEITLTGVSDFCEAYIRITSRLATGWQWSGGTVKQSFLQNTGNSGGNQQNAAPGWYSGSANSAQPSLVNAPNADKGTAIATNVWNDIEWYYYYVGTDSAGIKIWENGTLTVNDTDIQSSYNLPIDLVNLQWWSGGSDAKTAADSIQVSRAVYWFEAC
jgi:hypothetical protein